MRKINVISPKSPALPTLKRVAAYARVSMETERLHHSLSAQVSYYSDLIQRNPEWVYVGMYADYGVTGTKTNRSEFNRLLADCEAGKIDIVLTKSISRFARNTVDLLKTVRQLKELGIEVRFEKEGISSLSGDGEVMLTLLASFAQEEVISLSNNVKWSIRKRMAQGMPHVPFRIFGYNRHNGQLVINPEEAAIVQRIFQNFLDGKSRIQTARELQAEGKKTRSGHRWQDSNIKVILTNITYTGNLLLQKEFIEDPINKRTRKNKGELPQYYVENTHEPIIDLATFQYIQEEIARRKELGPFSSKSLNPTCFSGKINCGNCGCHYIRNSQPKSVGISASNEKKISWICGKRKKSCKECSNKTIPEDILKKICATALSLDEFDEDIFKRSVDYITARPDQQVELHYYDGKVTTHQWTPPVTIVLWTDERKAAQRKWMRNYMEKAEGPFSVFTTRVVCEHCGASYRRHAVLNRTHYYWRHSNTEETDCRGSGVREDDLRSACAELMGDEEFCRDKFLQQINKITVSRSKLLTFCFKDGHEITRQIKLTHRGRSKASSQNKE